MAESLEAVVARQRILDAVARLPEEWVDTANASGRWLSRDVASPLNLPPWDQSSMDGWAVRAIDGGTPPAVFRIVGRTTAGGASIPALGCGEAVRVFTGAPTPPGADAVVRQEDAEELPPPQEAPAGEARVRFRVVARRFDHLRLRGEDARAGQALLRTGHRLGPAQIGLLSALGLVGCHVVQQPRVALVASGDELQLPGRPLAAAEVYESNRPMLAALAAGSGARVVSSVVTRDDLDAIATALHEAANHADVVLVCGGASVGEADFARPAFQKAGGEIDFWRLNLKPGKPLFFGRLGSAVALGLPGNPVSAMVTGVLFLTPLLRRLQGAIEPGPDSVEGALGETVENPDSRPHWLRVRRDPDGFWRVAGPQGSHRIASLAQSQALIEAPAHSRLAVGCRVHPILL